ncbi:MAG: 16S rRNA (guanine(966)-N(2))-methyltransferase RsmD [Lachnospiraceae bacterium]|nr:16S rRNA (guanine(966)-N(2))-methyltransferase RsmD [Lachnospiraceae bacterium]
MRVIAGTARSLPLKTPEGLDTRPTTDRIKETLFNMLQTAVPGSVFVDLFSGSGGIGIEALSRGARHAYFVENGKKASACIRRNLDFTGFTDRATLLEQDVTAALSLIREKEVHLIYMDPPYQAGYEERVLQALAGRAYVTADTLIIIEAALEKDFSFAEKSGYRMTREKRYKTNKHIFLKRQEE